MEPNPPTPSAQAAEPALRRTRWVVVAAALLLTGGVLAVILSLSHGGATQSADVRVSGGAAPHSGQVPPQFTGTTIAGTHFDLGAERGNVVMVNFFATWCQNCKAELPLLERTYAQRHGQGLDIVTVDYNDGGDARAFLRSYGVSFPALLDPDSAIGHAYLVSDLPVTFFVGRDGRLAEVFHGQLSQQTLDAELQGLL